VIRDHITDLLARVLARTRFQKLNRFLFNLSLRGLGILNYRNPRESGETHFLEKVLACYYGPGVTTRSVVLDVGANVGDYSHAILSMASTAQIYCFEPHPDNVTRLEEALGGRVTVVRAAVGSRSGTAELYDYADGTGSSHASLHKDVFEKLRQLPHQSLCVNMVTIDDFLEDNDIAAVSLLKVDVEGHELEVFRGASKAIRERRVDTIHFEFNEMNVITRVFLADFVALLPGFAFYRLLPDGWIPITDRPVENVFAFQNIVAVRVGCPSFGIFAAG
jgi:FkbM family methyltransferase